MTPDNIAHYLSTHPEFFDQHPHLLTHVRVQHPFEGRAISITERQLLNLREKNALLETRLADFVRFGEENDQTAAKLHALALDLIAAKDLPELLAALYYHLQENFGLAHTYVRLWHIDQALSECAPCEQSVIDWVQNMLHPQCGATLHPDALNWLGENGELLNSFATIPVRLQNITYGVLVLASKDAARFFPEMGTIYLQQMGQLAAAALLRMFPDLSGCASTVN
ncbi:MAG: DUF484 family protein [Betaproteobacteria bacterium]|nr:DUF484 family protein [Betaproteobacteria bacterium]